MVVGRRRVVVGDGEHHVRPTLEGGVVAELFEELGVVLKVMDRASALSCSILAFCLSEIFLAS